MKKRSIAMLALAAMFMISSMGMAEDATLAAAQAKVPQGAELWGTDDENNAVEYTFENPTTGDKYEVTVSKTSGNVLQVEQEAYGIPGGVAVAIAEEQAQASIADQFPNAEILFTSLKEDDGRFTYLVIFRDVDALGVREINAETGDLKEQDVYYETTPGEFSAILTPAQAVEAIQAAHAGAEIQYMDLDEDHPTVQYKGKASVNGEMYEFEFSSYGNGSIVEFERD